MDKEENKVHRQTPMKINPDILQGESSIGASMGIGEKWAWHTCEYEWYTGSESSEMVLKNI